MSEIGASLLQLSGNYTNESNSFIPENLAIGYKTYNFNVNNELIINTSPIYDKIIPECIILSNNGYTHSLFFFQTYINPLTLNFTIDNKNILKIPLNLLWNLKSPEIFDNKLYLQIPFDMFFGKIHLCGLRDNVVKFSIEYSNIHLAGNNSMNIYQTQPINFELLCKTYSIDQRNIGSYVDISNNSIQQISSIQINVLNNINGHEFRIKTNRFRGFIKGFFIESTNIFNCLQEITFYTNQFIRFQYNPYLIKQKCIKINSDMIYFPFNFEEQYENNCNSSYRGSINFDGIESHFLNLKFLHRIPNIRIYALSKNNYTQIDGIFNIQNMYTSFNSYENFDSHNLTPIDELIRPFIQRDMPYVSQLLNRKIEEQDNNTCPIEQTEIQPNQRYMLCCKCQNCYNEYSIIEWFVRQNNSDLNKTCPTCREIWSDYNVYINNHF